MSDPQTTRIIARHARNLLVAHQTAQGMENAGTEVFSITHDGMHQPYGALEQSSRFIVWGKVKDASISFDDVDKAISKERGEDEEDEE